MVFFFYLFQATWQFINNSIHIIKIPRYEIIKIDTARKRHDRKQQRFMLCWQYRVPAILSKIQK